jgi:acetolactate synthase-1/2/3 large subunit
MIAEYLVRQRVPYLVGLCGHGDIGMLDALIDRADEIRTISVHHEAAAGFIADAYYRVRREPLATLTSCGPGSAQLLVALGAALGDSSALFAITGNVPTGQFGRGPFQELGRHFQADFTTAARPYVKRSFQATRPDQLPHLLPQAFQAMLSGRPGPVHLDVPLNVFAEQTPDVELRPPTVVHPAAAADSDIDATLDLLVNAHRPVIVVGQGAADGGTTAELHEFTKAVAAFSAETSIPVVTSPLGKDLADPRTTPLLLGPTGRNGTYQANRATRNADVILALGTRFDDRSTSSWRPGYTYAIPPSRLVHVHGDPAEIGRNYPAEIGIAASPATVLRQLNAARPGKQIRPETRRQWVADCNKWRAEWENHRTFGKKSDSKPLRPERVLADLHAVLPSDGIVLSDVGQHHNWIVQDLVPNGPGSLLQSWGFAAMGFGVAGALGARLAAPDRPVVAVVGDGGFLMLPSVIATAVQYDLPAVWLVWNNGGYISIRDQQLGYFGRELATRFSYADSGDPYRADYAAMARAMGGYGLTVDSAAELGPALRAALDAGRPTVVDVPVDASVSQPAVATWDLPPLTHPEPSFGWPDA